jgi:cytochrome c
MALQLTHGAYNMPCDARQNPEPGLNDNEAADLLSILVHTPRAHRAGDPPYTDPKSIKLGKRIIYKRKDLLVLRDREGIGAIMLRNQK